MNNVNSFAAKGKNKMCPPSEKKGFVKVKEHKKKTNSGGYTPVAFGLASFKNISGANAGSSSYSDYILYNYGAESERKRNS